MSNNTNTFVNMILVALLGVLVQLFLVHADEKDSPNKAVVEFAKAYFMIDQNMAERICSSLTVSDNVDVTDRYIWKKKQEAASRGYSLSMIRKTLYNIKTEQLTTSDHKAQVRITACGRTSIHPAFVVIAKIFQIGDVYSINEVIDVVKEDGKWKVCGNVFGLTEA